MDRERYVCIRAICRYFFFFQAEDGIRDLTVTGVQTCALPIFPLVQGLGVVLALVALQPQQPAPGGRGNGLGQLGLADPGRALDQQGLVQAGRLGKGRGGEEGRSRWVPYYFKKKNNIVSC